MRTTAAEVQEIMDTELTEAQITPYVSSANVFVTDALSSKSLGDDLLEEIERWVAAHMIAVTRERMALKEEAGGAKVEYTGVYGDGLNSTSYGQMAVALDTSGTLAAMSRKKIEASIVAITSFE